MTRHEDVVEYLHDHDRLSNRWASRVPKSPQRITPEQRFAEGGSVLAHLDPPTHTVYRRPMNKHFSVPTIRKLQSDIEGYVDEVIESISDRTEADFVEEIAGELPARVILRMLGVPESDWPTLREAVWLYFSSADPRWVIDGDPVKTRATGLKRLSDYTTQMALDRREHPRDDFATVIANMRVDDDLLSVMEIRAWLTALIAGGLETTRSVAAVGTWLFLRNPDQRDLLLGDPSLAQSAVEECLRWVTPASNRLRVATVDFEFHGRDIRAGDWVVGSLASANKDERVFTEPHRFDIARNPNPHVSFSDGIHMCLGRNLARLELQVFLPRILAALPDLEAIGEPVWAEDNVMNGFAEFPVRFSRPTRVAR
ncbi:cytochrome P450 [Glaciibacter sp. 2TAF33]